MNNFTVENVHPIQYGNDLMPPRGIANPYEFHRSVIEGSMEAHHAMQANGPGHAPALARLPINPSSISAKNIVRGFYQR